jgi:uncharacterized protein (TIGR02300 family)
VAKAEWGLKRICPHCGTRYYDMKKRQPACPGCGTVFDPDALAKARRGRTPVEEKPRKAVVPDVIDDLPAVEGEEPEDAVIEDADELGDDVDVEEVINVEEVDDKLDS